MAKAAKSKKGSAKRKQNANAKRADDGGPLAFFRSAQGRLLTRCLVGAFAFLLTAVVLRQARAHVWHLPSHRVVPSTIEFVGLPSWVDARAKRWLDSSALPHWTGPFSVSVYDPDIEATLRDRLERHPMIHAVRTVRVRYPNRASLRVALREPVGRVQFKQGKRTVTYYLSDDGTLLDPRPYRNHPDFGRVLPPLITGISSRPPVAKRGKGWAIRTGEVWEDPNERVAEAVSAAKVAKTIRKMMSNRRWVTRIDVKRFEPKGTSRQSIDYELGEVRFLLEGGPLRRGEKRFKRWVEWGRTDRARRDFVDALPDAIKLRALRDRMLREGPDVPLDMRWIRMPTRRDR